jgi:hypothetical protein
MATVRRASADFEKRAGISGEKRTSVACTQPSLSRGCDAGVQNVNWRAP